LTQIWRKCFLQQLVIMIILKVQIRRMADRSIPSTLLTIPIFSLDPLHALCLFSILLTIPIFFQIASCSLNPKVLLHALSLFSILLTIQIFSQTASCSQSPKLLLHALRLFSILLTIQLSLQMPAAVGSNQQYCQLAFPHIEQKINGGFTCIIAFFIWLLYMWPYFIASQFPTCSSLSTFPSFLSNKRNYHNICTAALIWRENSTGVIFDIPIKFRR
jgi:hypothetical protein